MYTSLDIKAEAILFFFYPQLRYRAHGKEYKPLLHCTESLKHEDFETFFRDLDLNLTSFKLIDILFLELSCTKTHTDRETDKHKLELFNIGHCLIVVKVTNQTFNIINIMINNKIIKINDNNNITVLCLFPAHSQNPNCNSNWQSRCKPNCPFGTFWCSNNGPTQCSPPETRCCCKPSKH